MSSSTLETKRATWASKTAFDALGVESGEDSDGELEPSPLISPPERYAVGVRLTSAQISKNTLCSSSESSVKPSKSALKKAKENARLLRQLERKAARAAQRAQANGQPRPADTLSGERSHDTSNDRVEPTGVEEESTLPFPTEPAAHGEDTPRASKQINGDVPVVHDIPAPVIGLSSSAVPSSVIPPAPPAPPRPADKAPPLPADTFNGDAKHETPPMVGPSNGAAISQAETSAQTAESAKKRQNMLTRTLWTFIMIGGFLSVYNHLAC